MGDEVKVEINAPRFFSRLEALHKHFSRYPELYSDASALQLSHGKRSTDTIAEDPFVTTVQQYLLGYEFPDSLMLLVGGVFYVHASAKKLEYLRPLAEAAANGPVTMTLLARDKDPAIHKSHIDVLIGAIKGAAAGDKPATVGGFPTDPVLGPIAQGWAAEVQSAGIEVVDASRGIEAYVSIKDAEALELARQAGHLTARVARSVFVKEMERAIENEDKSMTNAKLAEMVENSLDNLDKYNIKVSTQQYDILMRPVVQSGGEYNTHVANPTVVSDARPLGHDVIMFSMALRVKSVAAVLARTFFVDPTPQQLAIYDAVYDAQVALRDKLKPGVRICDAYNEVRASLLEKPNIPVESRIPRNFGTGFGLRMTDRALAINGKNETVVQEGMIFNVMVGMSAIPLTDATNPKTAMSKIKAYAVLVADTIAVGKDHNELLTEKLTSDRQNITYVLQDDVEEDDRARQPADGKGRSGHRHGEGEAAAASTGRDEGGRSARLRAREAESQMDEDARKAREEHLVELFQKKKEAALRRLRGEVDEEQREDGDDDLEHAPEIAAYKSSAEFPKGVKPTMITVDRAHDTVFLPLFGTLVPFHIGTIKSVVKSEEGPKAFLRVNFFAPGQSLPRDTPLSIVAALQKYPDLAYIRTLNFMSRDHRNMNQMAIQIKAMQKKLRQEREQERQQANLVEQKKLEVTKDAKVPRLMDLNMWPPITGRKTQGTLEAHRNGMRFVSNKSEKIEIIYDNIRHAVFQPCESEHVVLIHFHLHNAIMIGKKKFKDVQFFTEVIEASQALDGRQRSDFDADETAEEEREQRLRAALNNAFRQFVGRVGEIWKKSPDGAFEIPQRDLAFSGVPFKEMTTLMPCTDCLVALVDKPPFVASVADIEHVHFERVTFSSKNFDMVVIYKAGVKEKGSEEYTRIASIPMKDLDEIKNWLSTVADLTYTEGVASLNWKNIIDEFVRDDSFYLSHDPETGEEKPSGWDFLRDEAGDEEGEEEEDAESEYTSEEEDEEEEEDDEDEEFDELTEEDEESDAEEDDEEEGEDWEELERKAEEDDRKRKRIEDEEEERDRRKRGSTVKKSRR